MVRPGGPLIAASTFQALEVVVFAGAVSGLINRIRGVVEFREAAWRSPGIQAWIVWVQKTVTVGPVGRELGESAVSSLSGSLRLLGHQQADQRDRRMHGAGFPVSATASKVLVADCQPAEALGGNGAFKLGQSTSSRPTERL